MSAAPDLKPLVVDLIQRDAVTIPPYPGVAMRLRALVDGGKYGINELARLVAEDQVLAAGVLRSANSAAKRGVNTITTITEAISRLGSEELCRVALAVGLGAVAAADGPLVELRRITWRQGLASALVCRQLAGLRGLNPEQMFVAGLLHDFGRLVAIAAVESLLHGRPADWDRSEASWMSIIDEFHIELGLLTATRWKLPESLQAVIGGHHEPAPSGPHAALVSLVAASDGVVMTLERTPYILAKDLLPVPGVGGQAEADALMRILPMLPKFLTSIDEFSPVPKASSASRVVREGSSLTGAPRPVKLTAVWMKSGGDVTVDVDTVTDDGLVATGREKMRPGGLVWLRLDGVGKGPLEVCVRVLTCQPEGAIFRSEMRLYASAPAVQAVWRGIGVAA